MQIRELELLEAICHGVDPLTGDALDTPRDPALDRARLQYWDQLQRVASKSTGGAVAIMHGKRWAEHDDDKLRILWRRGENAATIADELGRGLGAIIARVVHLGLCPDRDVARQEHERRISGLAAGAGRD